jgi:hypothetical protein
MAAREWLRMQVPDFCLDKVKLLPELNKCIIVLCDFTKRNDSLVEEMSYV